MCVCASVRVYNLDVDCSFDSVSAVSEIVPLLFRVGGVGQGVWCGQTCVQLKSRLVVVATTSGC